MSNLGIIAAKHGPELADEFTRLLMRTDSLESLFRLANLTGKANVGTVLPDPQNKRGEFFELQSSAASVLYYSRRTSGGGYEWQITGGDLGTHLADLANPHVVTLTQAAVAGGTIAIGSDTTGTLAIARGGTGTTAFNADSVVVTDSFNNITAGVALPSGSFVGTTAIQALTNKTINGDLNTLSNLDHGFEVNDPDTGVHGVGGGDVVGTDKAQVLTVKTIDGDNNTITNLAHGFEVDSPDTGVHGVGGGDVVGTDKTQTLSGKTFSDAILTSDGRIDATMGGSGTAFVLDATNGGHTGALLDIHEAGSSRMLLNASYNLIMDNVSGHLQGGYYAGGNTEATWSGAGEQPHSSFFKAYAAQADNKQYIVHRIQGQNANNSVTTPNTDMIGVMCFSKNFAGNFSDKSMRSIIGGQFTGQDGSFGVTTQTSVSIEGGRFTINAPGVATVNCTDARAGYFLCQVSTGSNNKFTNMTWVDLIEPGDISTGSSVTNMYGVRIPDLNQDNIQATIYDAIKIASQTADGSVATDGNLNFYGGAWNTGHIQLGAAHIWFDGTNILGKVSAPTSASDGTVIV